MARDDVVPEDVATELEAGSQGRSPPPYGTDDFQLVAVLERRIGIATPRHDLSVALDGDAFAFHSQLADQIRNASLIAFKLSPMAVE
jgi:hypothetical protein